jgi:hypothetical protein
VANSGYPIERSACLSVKLGENAATDCGDLRIVHPLSGVRVFDTDVTPTLLYNSQFAHPRVTIPVTITQLGTTTQPDSVEVELRIGAFNTTKTLRGRAAWSGTDWPSGVTTTRRVTISVDALDDSTGVYAYAVAVGNWYGGTRYQNASQPAGGYHLVNRKGSPFGAGWWLAGVEQIKKYYHSGGTTAMLWIGGDGSTRTFTVGQAMYYERLDSLMYDGIQQVYVRRLPEGRRTEFNLLGEHVRTVNRFGRITTMVYDSTRLSTLVLPAPTGLAFGFAYTNQKLDSVVAPPIGLTKRADQVTVTGDKLVSIRNAGDWTVQFAYLTALAEANVMERRTSRRGVPQTFTFDAALKVRSASVSPGFGGGAITTTITAGESRGLATAGMSSAVDTARVYTLVTDHARCRTRRRSTRDASGRYGAWWMRAVPRRGSAPSSPSTDGR